jgi:hypothetical protein
MPEGRSDIQNKIISHNIDRIKQKNINNFPNGSPGSLKSDHKMESQVCKKKDCVNSNKETFFHEQ